MKAQDANLRPARRFRSPRSPWRVMSLGVTSVCLLMVMLLSGCNHADNGGVGGGTQGADNQAAGSQDAGKQSLKNLKRLGLGLNMWVQDHNETYPTIANAAAMKTALMPYVKDESAFVCPDTNEPYLPNPNLSGKSLSSIADVSNTVAFYEAGATDGTRGVAFVDGHAERIAESQWPQLKQSSGIP